MNNFLWKPQIRLKSTFFTFFFFFFACSSKQPVRILHSFCQHGSHITSLNHGEVPNCQVLMTYRMRCLRKSDLPVYMTVALAHIRFISDLFPHMNEAWIRSRYIWMHAFFFLFTLSQNRSDLCHIWAKNRNWVTFNWQCKRGLWGLVGVQWGKLTRG